MIRAIHPALFFVLALMTSGPCLLLAETPPPARAERPESIPTKDSGPLDAKQLTQLVRDSVVVVSFTGRNNQTVGLGSGFVISEDGLIATNLHVIGEARPILVQTADGQSFDVVEVHATDRTARPGDRADRAKSLAPLPLGRFGANSSKGSRSSRWAIRRG
jgi:serine protease Do